MYTKEILYFTLTTIGLIVYFSYFYVLGKQRVIHRADRDLEEEDYTQANETI